VADLAFPLALRSFLPDLGAAPSLSLPAAGWADGALAWIGGALGGAVDAAVVAAVQVAVDRLVAPAAAEAERLRASAAPFLDPALHAEPERFLDAGRHDGTPRSTERYLGPLAGGIRVGRRIRRDAADPIHVEQWLHDPGAARGTIVLVHGFAMGYTPLDARALFAAEWFARGLDVALYTLPLHGARAPRDSRFPGDGFATSDVARLNGVLRQAVHELACLVGLLRAESAAPVGVLGLSIGGTISALLAARDPELDFVIPMAPPACLGDLAWRLAAGARSRPLEASGLGADELRTCFRLVSPLAYPLRVPRERVLLVAGRGDRIVPPDHPQALWRHWGEPAIHWFGGSHLAPFGRRGVAEAIAAHLERLSIR
jgi:pimeloyl-ACP methyl ester carboxylesterase